MPFDPAHYGPEAASLLNLDGGGSRPMPLACAGAPNRIKQAILGAQPFAHAPHPQAALAGLWTYFSCFDEAHSVAQEDNSVEGSYWHGILHRQEPDPGNASYWFRRVKHHPVFEPLAAAARGIVAQHPGCGFTVATKWDPHAFIDYCESARQHKSKEAAALAIQLAEWQLLFDYCARPAKESV